MNEETTSVEMTPEQQELQSRIAEFNKELIPLLGKYELGLGGVGMLLENGTISGKPVLFDARPKGAPAAEAPAPEEETTSSEIAAA